MLVLLFLAGCGGREENALPPPSISGTSAQETPTQPSAESPLPSNSALVFYLNNGNIHAWEEGSGDTGTVFDGRDAISVTLSPDNQLIAFMRRTHR